jgi:hypothetical protein
MSQRSTEMMSRSHGYTLRWPSMNWYGTPMVKQESANVSSTSSRQRSIWGERRNRFGTSSKDESSIVFARTAESCSIYRIWMPGSK